LAFEFFAAIQEVLALTRSKLHRHGVALHMELYAPLPQVLGDKVQLQHVLLNLITNARDAMPNGGKITICTAIVDLDETSVALNGSVSPGRYVALSVTDTG